MATLAAVTDEGASGVFGEAVLGADVWGGKADGAIETASAVGVGAESGAAVAEDVEPATSGADAPRAAGGSAGEAEAKLSPCGA